MGRGLKGFSKGGGEMSDRSGTAAPAKKKRINIELGDSGKYNEYYLRVSNRYRTLKFISLALLVIYLIAMLLIYRSNITYENLVYLMKDLDTDVDATSVIFPDIKFDESSKLSGAIFKGRFAAATTGSLTLYNTAGAAEREFKIAMENPKVLAGDKYVMVYDVGGSSYSICTPIVQTRSKQTEYPLQGACLSDSGAYALITRARENRYVVTIYDGNFREVSKIYKDKYVMDASLSPDGRRFAIVSCEVDGTGVTCEVMSGSADSENALVVNVADAMPLSVGHFDSGAFYVVCDGAVLFFSERGDLVNEIRTEGNGILGVSATGRRLMVAVSDNLVDSSFTATVYDESGGKIASHTVSSKMSACALGENAMFFAYDDVLEKVSMSGDIITAKGDLAVTSLVPYSENVLVLTPGSARTGFAAKDSSAESEGTAAESAEAPVTESESSVEFAPVE